MSWVDAGKYLQLHHRQPLACRFCRDAPHALYAIHYHWAFARHTGSLVPCLRTMVNHKVKDILNLKPNLCFPTSQPGIIGKNSTSSLEIGFSFQTYTFGKQRFGLVSNIHREKKYKILLTSVILMNALDLQYMLQNCRLLNSLNRESASWDNLLLLITGL